MRWEYTTDFTDYTDFYFTEVRGVIAVGIYHGFHGFIFYEVRGGWIALVSIPRISWIFISCMGVWYGGAVGFGGRGIRQDAELQ